MTMTADEARRSLAARVADRALARLAPRDDRRIGLVDRANDVRLRTRL